MDTDGRSWFPLSILLLYSLFPITFSSHPHRHLLQSTPSTPSSSSSTSENGKPVAAIVATATASFVLSGLFFLVIFCLIVKRSRSEPQFYITNHMSPLQPTKVERNHKGVIIDESGLEALYWCGIGDASPKRCKYCNSILKRFADEEDDLRPGEKSRHQLRNNERGSQGIPLLPSNSINSSSIASAPIKEVPDAPPPPPPAPPPPPPLVKKGPAPPPPPPARKGPYPPPPNARRGGGPPAPPGSSRPPLAPDSGKERPRMKPLHWDKVTPANAGQSMVWDKITNGSIKFDDELIESLFGYVPNNLPNLPSSTTSTSGTAPFSTPTPAQIRILDPRKSQNIAIILRTLAVSRQDIIDGLLDGHGLARDTLEKLSRICPSADEESLIVSYSGCPSQLAEAELFLFHILHNVPSALPRVAALHFRCSVYDPEILHLKDSLQTLEIACMELRTRALFLKLIEATLKAGNRMNAGTARGNAQAFDLIALRKLSGIKSTDGKTSLLHFVVEEVVRSEGKRCAVVSRTKSIRQLGSTVEQEAQQLEREEREREYIMLGLPIVGGLSVEFANVKKAAGIDHDMLAGVCSMLEGRVADIRKLAEIWKEEEGEFVREMAEFVEASGQEIDKIKEEQGRVMEKVRRTTEYYQPGASKDKTTQPLQLFVIVRDFLAMVDQACIDINRDQQKRKKAAPLPADDVAADRLTASKVAARKERFTTRFPNLSDRLTPENTILSSDSEEGDDF